MRSPTRNTQSIAPPSNNLLSRQASDDVVIFNFNANVADATINSSSHLRRIVIASDAAVASSSKEAFAMGIIELDQIDRFGDITVQWSGLGTGNESMAEIDSYEG